MKKNLQVTKHNDEIGSYPIESLKDGDLFTITDIREPKAGQVWVKDGYNRFTKTYSAYCYDDINRTKELKKGKIVFVGFTF